MKKIVIIGVLLLLLSGCVGTGIIQNGKYVSGKSTFGFSENNIFYATEYMNFTQQTVELVGVYDVSDDELILTYKMFGAVRRFQITNNSHTLIEKDDEQMRFEWVKS